MLCSPFSSLLFSQQFTNLAAVFAHCCAKVMIDTSVTMTYLFVKYGINLIVDGLKITSQHFSEI